MTEQNGLEARVTALENWYKERRCDAHSKSVGVIEHQMQETKERMAKQAEALTLEETRRREDVKDIYKKLADSQEKGNRYMQDMRDAIVTNKWTLHIYGVAVAIVLALVEFYFRFLHGAA